RGSGVVRLVVYRVGGSRCPLGGLPINPGGGEAWDDGRARSHDPPHGTPKVRLAWSWWSDGFAGLGRLAGRRGGVGGSLLQIGLMYIIIGAYVRWGTQRAVFISFA